MIQQMEEREVESAVLVLGSDSDLLFLGSLLERESNFRQVVLLFFLDLQQKVRYLLDAKEEVNFVFGDELGGVLLILMAFLVERRWAMLGQCLQEGCRSAMAVCLAMRLLNAEVYQTWKGDNVTVGVLGWAIWQQSRFPESGIV